MNQRMVCTGRSGSVAFWAWMASIVVHLIVLTAFGVVVCKKGGQIVTDKSSFWYSKAEFTKLGGFGKTSTLTKCFFAAGQCRFAAQD
jgi:hypothetical protein